MGHISKRQLRDHDRHNQDTLSHGILASGLKTDYKSRNEKISYWTFYTEISTLESYIRAFVVSNGEIDVKDVWTFSAGIAVRFRN